MFEEEDALPGAKLHPATIERDHFTRAGQNRANVRGAVVAAFRGVFEPERVLRHELLEKFLKITPRTRVGILHDDETATRMPYEYRDRAGPDSTVCDRRRDLLRDFVGPLPASRDGKIPRVDAHRRRPR